MANVRPQSEGNEILGITAPRLGFRGSWKRLDAPIEQTFLATPAGSVHWNCLQPRALSEIEIDDHAIKGFGYAECLTLTIPPWKLPLQKLQWGRWLAADSSIVWVNWSGDHSGRWVWHNSVLVDTAAVAATELDLGGGKTLGLDRAFPLREGSVDKTVLPGAPALARIFPRSIFAMNESKWLSRGEFVDHGRKISGWAIHEVVEWPA